MMKEKIKLLKLEIIPECGHLKTLEVPDEVCRLITEWINEKDRIKSLDKSKCFMLTFLDFEHITLFSEPYISFKYVYPLLFEPPG